MGRYNPKSLSRPSQYRFVRDRRSGYLARIVGPPSNMQSATIESLVVLEWSAIVAEAEGGLVGFREAREHRRLFQRLLSDFERSLASAQSPPAAADDSTRRALAELLKVQREREEAAGA